MAVLPLNPGKASSSRERVMRPPQATAAPDDRTVTIRPLSGVAVLLQSQSRAPVGIRQWG